MKYAGLFILLLASLHKPNTATEKVLTLHPWFVFSNETFQKKDDKYDRSKPKSTETKPPICGQTVEFLKDHSCKVNNKGQGIWNTAANSTWTIVKNQLCLESNEPCYHIQNIFRIEVINENEIRLVSSEAIGVETGIKIISVWKLIKG